MRTQVILNPSSGRGRALAVLPEITRLLQQFQVEADIVRTERPGQQVALARQAVANGYERLVAAGGDGTCHEVVNGLLAAGLESQIILGIIPTGSGNDFAYALGIPPDPAAACALLKDGAERQVDAGRVTVDGEPRFFMNNVGLGLDAEAAIKSARIQWLRGHTLYLWSALYTIALGRWPYNLQFSLNGQRHHHPITLFTVANGSRVGGGFHLTPHARLDDGLFDVIYAGALSKLALLNLLPQTFRGTHLNHPAIRLVLSKKVEILAEAGIPAYVDGEILCPAGRQFLFEVIPGALRVWA